MSGGGGLHVPVPDEAPTVSASQLPWQAIPKFSPGVTNVQDYVRKLKFLASIWPPEHLDLLAPRAALQVEGSAFTLVSRLDGSKLRVKSLDGVTLLVETLGGQWGSTELEERYEYFEKAIYATTQRHDESNDSFISRMESFFTELVDCQEDDTGGNPGLCVAEAIYVAGGGQEKDSPRAWWKAFVSPSGEVTEADG